jgi:LPXTG-motif cell wall-anchored protein
LKQAKTVEEILSIESQLSNVRTEIESAEGKLNYLKSQISMSTLTITYYEVIGTDFGFGSKFANSLREGWDNLLLFLIGLTSIWPFVLVIGGGAFWFWRKRKNKKLTVGSEQ